MMPNRIPAAKRINPIVIIPRITSAAGMNVSNTNESFGICDLLRMFLFPVTETSQNDLCLIVPDLYELATEVVKVLIK